jgi:hypothetical protein
VPAATLVGLGRLGFDERLKLVPVFALCEEPDRVIRAAAARLPGAGAPAELPPLIGSFRDKPAAKKVAEQGMDAILDFGAFDTEHWHVVPLERLQVPFRSSFLQDRVASVSLDLIEDARPNQERLEVLRQTVEYLARKVFRYGHRTF